MGDLTFIGWSITILYLVTAALCWRVSRADGTGSNLRVDDRQLWRGMSWVLLMLGLNKQLDLQWFLFRSGTWLARHQGWYEQRRIVQALFATVFAVALVILLSALGWRTRHHWKRYRLALVGWSLLACFVVIRSTTFNHLFQHPLHRAEQLHLTDLCESAGILFVLADAWRAKTFAHCRDFA